ncbi:MAG: hypothetical protein VX733_11205 [Candidatus Latescibacterota bacterium]|nr:hypothetical protein [Candidatus Latescibacterota bacterium]
MAKSKNSVRKAGTRHRAGAPSKEVIDLGSRRELFVDDFLIDRSHNVELRLHKPVPRNVAIEHDTPWEGNTCCYHTVFRDDRLFRAYFRGSHYTPDGTSMGREVVCYAESYDGIEWHRPELELVNYQGSKRNNVIWDGIGSHNFAPFRDLNPNCREGEEYKAMGSHGRALYAFKSSDGVHWSLISKRPVITEGAFDSQNLAFWDPLRERYVDYHRNFVEVDGKRVRQIMTCTSRDFRKWTKPKWIDFGDAPLEHLYTNAVTPYHRAPHIYMGFPKRFLPERSMFGHEHRGMSDAVYMTSRDGLHFKRWTEAFIRPGLQPERWENRNNMTAWGILETDNDLPSAPRELSIFTTEGYYRCHACRLRRFTLRLDGFVSANASLSGGELVTPPFTSRGANLQLNVATSAAGSVRVEIQDGEGKAIRGHALRDCDEIYGDELERIVTWKGRANVSALADRPVRLRFSLHDADLYSLRFTEAP